MLKQFDHIYWLGGSPCVGKSSIAEQLRTEITYHAEQFQLILADLRQMPAEKKILVDDH